MIERRMNENSDKVKKLLARFIEKLQNSDEEFIKSKIRTIPDFPKQGIMFRDITTLLKDNDGMKKTMEILQNRYKDKKIDIIAGIESRGFIFGSILADRLNAKFVPIRKRGKLPYQIIKQEYDLEYGKDIIEIHIDAVKRGERVLIIDDLIATGGTALAACQLVEKMGAIIEECAFVVELPELKGREKIGNYKMFSVVRFEGE
jgi:adenine phosphoribosyltransferase